MDEQYIQDLWNWTTSQDPTFTDRYTFESWSQKLRSDEGYRQDFHSWVSSQDNTFSKRRPFDSWSELVGGSVKKKEDTDLSLEDGSSESQDYEGMPFLSDMFKPQGGADPNVDRRLVPGAELVDELQKPIRFTDEIIEATKDVESLPAEDYLVGQMGIRYAEFPNVYENTTIEEKIKLKSVPDDVMRTYDNLLKEQQGFADREKDYQMMMRAGLEVKKDPRIKEVQDSISKIVKDYSLDAGRSSIDFTTQDEMLMQDIEGMQQDIDAESVDYFDETIDRYDEDFLSSGARNIVSKLNSELGIHGFKSEEITGRYATDGKMVKITAPDGTIGEFEVEMKGEGRTPMLEFIKNNKPPVDMSQTKFRNIKDEEENDKRMAYLNKINVQFRKEYNTQKKTKEVFDKELAAYELKSEAYKKSPEGVQNLNNLKEMSRRIKEGDKTLAQAENMFKRERGERYEAMGRLVAYTHDPNRGTYLGSLWDGITRRALGAVFAEGGRYGDNFINNIRRATGTEPEWEKNLDIEEGLNVQLINQYLKEVRDIDATWDEVKKDVGKYWAFGEEDLRKRLKDYIIDQYYKRSTAGQPLPWEKGTMLLPDEEKNTQMKAADEIVQKSLEDKGSYYKIKEDLFSGLSSYGEGGTESEAFTQAWQERSMWGKVLNGVAESLPSMVFFRKAAPGSSLMTKGAVIAGSSLPTLLHTSSFVTEAMDNNPEFDNVSENEKQAVSFAIGLPVALLERAGFVKGFLDKNPWLANSVAKIALSRGGANITAKTFKANVIDVIENPLLKKLAVVGTAGLTEAETGALQEMVDIGVKQVYDAVKGVDMFNEEKFGANMDWVLRVGKGAFYEGMGGFVMGSVPAIATKVNTKDFSKIDPGQWEVFKMIKDDPKIMELSDQDFVDKVVSGEMTSREALKIKNNYKEAVNALNQIDDINQYTEEQQKDALGLVLRLNELDSRIKGKNKELSTRDIKEREEIRKDLVYISENAGSPTYTLSKVDQELVPLNNNNQVADDAEIELKAEKIEDIPEQYRERAEEKNAGFMGEVSIHNNVAGLPIGQRTRQRGGTYYTYKLTGKEINNAIQKQSTINMDAAQSAANVQEVAEGTSATGPEVTAEQVVETPKETTITEEQSTQLNDLGFTPEMQNLMTDKDIQTSLKFNTKEEAAPMLENYTAQLEEMQSLKKEGIEGEVVGVEGEVVVNNKNNETITPTGIRVMKAARKALRSVKERLPKLKIIAHATPEEYHAALGQEMTADNRGERGEIRLSKDGSTIHLNMQFTDDTTIFHEVFHDLLYQNFGIKDMNIQELVSKDLINKIMKVIKRGEFTIQGQDMYDYLENYIKDYKEENVHDEEKLSEIFGALSTQYNVLAPKVRTAIQEFIRKIAKALNIKMPETFTKDDLAVVNMLNTLAFKLRTGEVIQEEDIDIKVPTKTREELDAERKELEKEREEAKKKEEEKRKKAEGKKKPTKEGTIQTTVTQDGKEITLVDDEVIEYYDNRIKETEDELATETDETFKKFLEDDLKLLRKERKEFADKLEKETTTEEVVEEAPAEEVVEEEVVEEAPAAKKKNLYYKSNLVDAFAKENETEETIFRVEVDENNPNQGRLFMEPTSKEFNKAINGIEGLKDKYMDPINMQSWKEATNIKTIEPAIVVKEGTKWVVKQKMKTEFVFDSDTGRRRFQDTTSRKQVAADGSVAPMEISQEFTKLSPTQKRKQLAGRYSKLSHELSRDLLKAQTEYRYADRYERLSKSKNPADIKLFNKQYQQNPPKTKKQIFAGTHWYRGIDGKYRYEIPDGKLVKGTYEEFTREGADPTIREARLDEIYIAPEVYKAYPQLKDIMVQFEARTEKNKEGDTVPDTTTAGSWSNANQIIKINTNFKQFAEATPIQQRNEIFYTLIHEVQHAIQHIEGFALGGNVKESKAGRGKRIKEKFGEGRESLTKEGIFAYEAQKGLRKKYEILRINNEVASYLVTTLNTLDKMGDVDNVIKLLKSKNKGRDLVKILEEYEATDPTLNRIYKEIKADARYYNKELGRTKVNMTQKNLANLLENAVDRYGLNNASTPKQIDDVNTQLKKMMLIYDAGNMYSRMYGEMEARNVETRAKRKKELARLKSDIAKIELLGKRKDINALEKIERIEQLENQLYKELPSYTEQFDKQGVVDDIDIDVQGPYIIQEQAQGRRKQVESTRKQLPAREASMEDVILWGRSRNLTDNKIQALLLERKLGTRDEIKEALRNVVEVTAMPEELANIEGGVQAGEQMFEDVMTEFYRQTMETKEVVEDSASRTNKALEIMRNDEDTYGKETKDKGVFKKNGKSITIYKTKAKNGVKLITVTEIIGEPARAMKNVFTKTKGQRREILLDLLEKNKIYKKQSEFVKAMVAVVMDKTLNTRANQDIETEIRAAKRLVRAAKKETKLEQEARNRVEKLIREQLPKKMVSKDNLTKLKRLLKSVRDTNNTNALAKADEALQTIEEITQNEIKEVKEKIESTKGIIARKANPKSGVDGITNLYFQSLKKVLTIYTTHEGDALTEALDKFEQQLEEKNIDGILRKLSNKEKLDIDGKTTERSVLYDNNAYELMRDYDTMTLEEVRDLHNEIKLLKKEGIEKYKSIREVRRKELEKLDEEVTEQIKENQPFVVDEDGNIIDPKNKDMVKAARDDYRKGNLYSEMKQYFRDLFERKGLKNTILFGWMYNLPNILSRLDNIPKGQDFLTRNIYERLKRAEEKYLGGTQREAQIFNDMLMTIPAIKEKVRPGRSAYAVFRGMLSQNNETAVNKKGKDLKFKDAYGNTITLTKDEALRVYALSKNEIQRARLLNGKLRENEIKEGNGYSEKILQDIETYLGEDLIKVADLTVNYLSNNYFDGINKVYQQTNNSSLQQTPNYFPTKTIQNDVSTKEVMEGEFNFGRNFTAEYMSALKRRSAVKGAIDINKTDNFTSTLDNHFENMERFKAYALDVKTIRDIFRFKSVDALMKITELDNIINKQINSNINPNFVINNKTLKARTWVGKVQNWFVTYVLAQKPLQVLGQASSFITAYSDHKTRYKGLTALDREVVALTSFSLGIMEMIAGYGVDLAIASGIVNKSKWIDYSTFNKAFEISATFRNRITEGMQGDLWGLESGAKVRKELNEDRYPKLKKYKRIGQRIRMIAGSPTLIGDALGVMGYMINYKANKRQGMSEEEALLEFNKYEQTQQTRSTLEKNMLQLEGDDITRQLTMFHSTFFLQINRLSMSVDNIFKGMKKGNKVRAKDVRDFYTQLFVANAMYVLAKNIFRLTEGDDEDRKDIWLQIQRAAMGMNQLKSIPIVGLAIEQGEYWYDDKPYTAASTNPVRQFVVDGLKMYSDEEKSRTEKLLTFVKQITELRVGVRVDPVIAFYKYFFEGDEIYEDQYFYDMINAPKSLRPNAEGRKKAKEMYESLVPVLGEKDAKIYVDEVMKIRKENEEEMRKKD